MSFTDTIDFHDGFQTLELDFSPAANCSPWPKAFESHLNAIPPVSLCKKLDQLLKPDPCPNMTSLPHFKPEPTFESPPGTPSRQESTCPASKYISPLLPPISPTLTKARRGVHYEHFIGSGTDAEPYHCRGILHPLPPQHAIPGWHRITMMKYFDPADQEDASPPSSPSGSETPSANTHSPTSSHSSISPRSTTSPTHSPHPINDKPTSFTPVNTPPQLHHDYETEDVDVDTDCWAYEGVVLPGGKIMLGRWWSPIQDGEEMTCIGPFIFWEVEGA